MNGRSVILTFHGIGHPTRPFWPKEELYWVESHFFEAVLDLVKDRRDTLVTFDDGNVSDFEVALPALQARGMHAHFYIASELLGKSGFLSEGQVRALHQAGMTIGNHGKFHRSWRGLGEGELAEEFIEARERLESMIGRRVALAACPNGSYDRRVLRHLRACGYERVYTSDRGWACERRWLQPRNSLLRSLHLDDVKRILTSSPFSREGLVRLCKRTLKRWR